MNSMKKIYQHTLRTLWLMTMLLGLVAPTQAQSDLDELPLTIKAVSVADNSITLAGLGSPEREYRMAFDIRIRLINREQGTPAGLEVNDHVTALVDPSAGVVHALFVVGKQ